MLASVGSVGDAYDNALAESFVDSYKTELIADRVWRTRAQLELATVEWVGWYNHERLHEVPRRHPARRVRGSIRQAVQSNGSTKENQNLQTHSPWNPVRLTLLHCGSVSTGGPLLDVGVRVNAGVSEPKGADYDSVVRAAETWSVSHKVRTVLELGVSSKLTW